MRGLPVCLRNLTAEEASAVKVLAHSRTALAHRVERARLVWRASRGERPPCIAAALGVSADTVRRRIRWFNAEGRHRFKNGCGLPLGTEAVSVLRAARSWVPTAASSVLNWNLTYRRLTKPHPYMLDWILILIERTGVPQFADCSARPAISNFLQNSCNRTSVSCSMPP